MFLPVRPSEILAAFPERVRAGTQKSGLAYIKRSGCAVHNRPFDTPAPGAMLLLNDGQIAVYPDEPPSGELEHSNLTLTAVYVQPATGGLAVPTGLVFVRFKDTVNAESRRAQIRQAGFEIAEVVAYAPQAAWVQSASGNAAEALARVENLERLPDVENVEPQMLLERAQRD